ncbi:MAG: DUF3179 domain-containing protein [Anaerolineales bacterium]
MSAINAKLMGRMLTLFSVVVIFVSACSPAPTSGSGNTTNSTGDGSGPSLPSNATSTPETLLQEPDCEDPFEGTIIRFRTSYWDLTDFCKHSVDYDEIFSGGPPPDGIRPIDNPTFETVAQADSHLGIRWPVMVFEWNGDARAYPLYILVWHEIVNDVVGGLPVAITYCPLCNATIAFDRTLPDGRLLDFGTTGNLRNSDLVMYDRQTQSWWQQFTGEAIVGELTGTQLQFLPSQIVAWEDFKQGHPDGSVLAGESGSSRRYGQIPYVGYDDIDSIPFLFSGALDTRLPAMERVAAVKIENDAIAYPFSDLSEARVVNDTVGEKAIVVFWKSGTNSALDPLGAEGRRDIGSTAVFLRQLDDQELTFRVVGEGIEDIETGSLWNIFGQAVEGSLLGSQLTPVVFAEHFWFAWAAFEPATAIWSAPE